jgi:hypothetical protein
MSSAEFDINSLSPEAYASLVIDQTLAPVVADLGAAALDQTLHEIASAQEHEETMIRAGIARGLREAEAYVNPSDVSVADEAAEMLRTQPSIADEAEGYLHYVDTEFTGYAERLARNDPFPFLPGPYTPPFDGRGLIVPQFRYISPSTGRFDLTPGFEELKKRFRPPHGLNDPNDPRNL